MPTPANSRPTIPRGDSLPQLPGFFRHLTESDFTFDNLLELFPDTTLTGRDSSRQAAYRLSASESGKRAHQLARLWLLREPLSRPDWDSLLGCDVVEQGLELGLINGTLRTHLEACFDVQPAVGDLFLTDPKFRHTWESDKHGVYYLGSDSYALAYTVPRQEIEDTLDLFSGSGIHAVLAASHSRRVVGVDINPRAVSMGYANAALNQKTNICTFLQGNLFQPVNGRKFDLITANPPFVPTPDQDLALYRSGGESGELLTAEVLEKLHLYLKPGGMLAMVTNYPVFQDRGILEHHRSLLGEPERFGIALLHSYTFPREMYIQMHLAPTGDPVKDAKDQQRWLESYHRQKIKGMGFGVLFFCHLPEGEAWSVRKDNVNLVHKPMSTEVARWLQGAREFGPGRSLPEKLVFHPDCRLYQEQRTGQGVIGWDSEWPPLKLSAQETETACRMMENEPFSPAPENETLIRKLGSEGALQSISTL